MADEQETTHGGETEAAEPTVVPDDTVEKATAASEDKEAVTPPAQAQDEARAQDEAQASDAPDRHHEHPGPLRPQVRAALSPTMTLLLGTVGVIALVTGLKQVGSIVAPTFLAITLIIAVYPVYRWLARFVPQALAGVVLLLMLYGILAALIASIGVAAGRLATELPQYSDTFATLVDDGRAWLLSLGIHQQQIDDAVQGFDLKDLSGLAKSLASTLGSLTSSMLFLLTVMLFLVMDSGGFGNRLAAIHRSKPDIADALVDFGLRVRKYWVVSTVFGLIVAVIDGIALMILDVPLALTFGLLAFVTNYIPNIGFVLGLVPPALLALLDGGVEKMIWVIVVYCLVNFVIQTVLQPKFTGDAVGITATVAFLSLVFWSYVLGALGAILAIPCTLLFKSLLVDRDPSARWVNQLIASHPKEGESAQPL